MYSLPPGANVSLLPVFRGSRYLVSRKVLYKGEQRHVIPSAPTPCHQRLEHLVDDRRGRQRDPVLPARLQGYPEVLAVELDLAARLEVVLDLHRFLGFGHGGNPRVRSLASLSTS